MYKVALKVDTQYGKNTLHPGDEIVVDDATAKRWEERGVAISIEKSEDLNEGEKKDFTIDSIPEDVKAEIIDPINDQHDKDMSDLIEQKDAEKDEALKDKDDEITALKAEIEKKDAEIADLKKKPAAKDKK